MLKIFIDGAAGTTGLEIAERLSGRREFMLLSLDDCARKDITLRRAALNAADIVILCLPDAAAREAVALIDNPATRVIDASTAHRTAADWTYGFPEIVGRDRVAGARRVANPGCYATGFIALVAPLVRAGIIAPETMLSCHAVSGYSGGGKAVIAEYARAAPPAWRTYALGLAHKHGPEMQAHAGLTHAPLFAPSVANVYRGMLVDVPVSGIDPDAARDTLAAHYAGSQIVRLCAFDAPHLAIDRAADSDRLDLFVFSNGHQTRLVAAFDNLGKGASGAAVQSLNLMAGLPESTGLKL